MIHPTAIIDPKAELASNVEVGPWSYIGPNVQIDEGTIIAPHVVIKGPTKIGKNNHFFQFASIGEDPQDKKYRGEEDSSLEIGDNNIFRENTTVNRGTFNGGGVTKIANDCLFMAYVHIAHDCNVGSDVIISNSTSLAGHVTIEDNANIGGFVGIFQFCTIGKRAFLAGGSMVVKDVPPYVAVSGYPAKVCGLNTVGLKRAGFNDYDITVLRRAYKILYRQGLTLKNAISEIEAMVNETPVLTEFLDFIKGERSRSIIR